MTLMKRTATCLAVTAAAMITLPAPALAEDPPSTTVLQGTWYEATAATCGQTAASGRWSITFRKDGTAMVSQTVFLDGKLHAAFGGSSAFSFTWDQTATGYQVTADGLSFTIDGDRIRLDIPGRYPDCDAYVLGTVTNG